MIKKNSTDVADLQPQKQRKACYVHISLSSEKFHMQRCLCLRIPPQLVPVHWSRVLPHFSHRVCRKVRQGKITNRDFTEDKKKKKFQEACDSCRYKLTLLFWDSVLTSKGKGPCQKCTYCAEL